MFIAGKLPWSFGCEFNLVPQMSSTASPILQSFLSDPADPRWSSYRLDCLFSELRGSTKEKLQQILPEIDERLNATPHPLTETQVTFLRDVTIRNFYGTHVPFTADELSWLTSRFDRNPTPQRAVMIALLILLEDIKSETSDMVRSVLVGTPGACWAILD